MKTKQLFNFMLILVSVVFLGCNKENHPPINDIDHGGMAPWREMEIFIENPTENTTIQYGDKVLISGRIEGNFLMHGYSIRIYNGTEEDERIFVKNRHTHGETIIFEGEWVNDVEEPGILTIEILAVGNHEGTLDMFERITVQNMGKE